jgi:hypothetical protein
LNPSLQSGFGRPFFFRCSFTASGRAPLNGAKAGFALKSEKCDKTGMSKMARSKPALKSLGNKLATPLQEQTLRLARMLIDSLPPDIQEQFARELKNKVRAAHPPGKGAGEVLKEVIQILPTKRAWKPADVMRAFEERGISASAKEVYNALNYLARTGRLRRVRYGQYLFGSSPERARDLGRASRRKIKEAIKALAKPRRFTGRASHA